MSYSLEIIENSSESLSNSWGVEEVAMIKKDTDQEAYDSLLEKVTWVITYLIEKDFEKLLWLLYKVDVSEKKIRDTLDGIVEGDVAEILAKMVIERECQKAKTRLEYRNHKRTKEDDLDPERW